MKKILLPLLALCCFSAVMAQQKTRSLSVELLGAQNAVGINYDSRFNGNSGFGYRVGIGYVLNNVAFSLLIMIFSSSHPFNLTMSLELK